MKGKIAKVQKEKKRVGYVIMKKSDSNDNENKWVRGQKTPKGKRAKVENEKKRIGYVIMKKSFSDDNEKK